jgi:predicted dehydrogenase
MSGAADLKVGLIGLDTSHCVAFAQILNDPSAPNHLPGARIVAAVKTFSPDIAASASRVEEYTATVRDKFGVKIVPSIADLCAEVDVVMIESLDGRVHLEQARPVIAAGKRLFIDKPMAGSLRDVLEIFRLARDAGVPVFTSSAYRFYPSLRKVIEAQVGEARMAISYGPAYLDPHHPDLFFYGIHPVEALFAVMGCGCESVVRTHTADSDVVTGQWAGGRVGTLHGLRTKAIPHKVIVFGSEGFVEQQPLGAAFSRFGSVDAGAVTGGDNYAALLQEILAFFQTGVEPVKAEETIEMFAFMEAADESKRRGGVPVLLSEVIGH